MSGWALAAAFAILAFVVMSGDGNGEESLRNGETPELTGQPTPTRAETEPSPTSGPLEDRRDCGEITGTEYRSPSEREWFLDHCITPAVDAAATATPPPTQTPEGPDVAEAVWGTRDPVEGPGATSPPIPLLVHVGVGTSNRFGDPANMAIFTFERALPGYRVEYVDPPIIHEGSGLPVDIAGNAFLRVTFYIAAAHNESGEPTIDRTEHIPTITGLMELEQTGDVGGYVTWVIGLSEEADFAVRTHDDALDVTVYMGRP